MSDGQQTDRELFHAAVRSARALGADLTVTGFVDEGLGRVLEAHVSGQRLLIGPYNPDAYDNIVDVNAWAKAEVEAAGDFRAGMSVVLGVPQDRVLEVVRHVESLHDLLMHAVVSEADEVARRIAAETN